MLTSYSIGIFLSRLLLSYAYNTTSIRLGVPNLPLTMYPFSISTDEHVPLKFLMTKRLSKITKIH